MSVPYLSPTHLSAGEGHDTGNRLIRVLRVRGSETPAQVLYSGRSVMRSSGFQAVGFVSLRGDPEQMHSMG
jgi:hypothetical protein